MATKEQEQKERKDLVLLLDEIGSIRAADLIRQDQLGQELNFSSGLPYFERAILLFRDLKQTNLESVPYQPLHQLLALAQQARAMIKQVQEFSIQKHAGNPTGTRDSFIAQVRDNYDTWWAAVSPVIAYSARKGLDFDRLEQQAKSAAMQVETLSQQHREKGEASLKEIESIKKSVQQAAQEVGVAKHANLFKTEADDHEKAAKRWLVAVVVLALLTVAAGAGSFYLFVSKYADLSSAEAVQYAIAKVVVFSALFSILVWAAHNYGAHRHNTVVNKHRQNALSTFETFVKASMDDQTKAAVLLQSTQCIFGPQTTGYGSGRSEAPGTPQVLEIYRSLGGTKQ